MAKHVTISTNIKKIVQCGGGGGGTLSANQSFDSITLNTEAAVPTSPAQGQMWWDADEETYSLRQNGAILQLGQEQQWHITNNSGVQINDGNTVMATGALGASGRITGSMMDGSDPLNGRYLLGLATETIPNGEDGKVTSFGKIRGIDTSGATYSETWEDGDILWVDPVNAGALTNVEPSGDLLGMPVAYVVKAHASTGTLAVRITAINENLIKQAFTSQIIDRTESEVTAALALLPAGSRILSATVSADPVETELPVVTAFVLGTPTLLTVPITTFTATDNVGVTGYLVNEVATEPTLGDAGWSGTAQTSYTAASAGATTLYAWAKDAAGNISLALSASYTAEAPADASPVFTSQPTVTLETSDGFTLNYGWSDAESDSALIEYSTDNGSTYTTAAASEAPGAGKTIAVTGLAASTAFTCYVKITPLTGNTTPVLSNSVVGTTTAAGAFTPSDLFLTTEEGAYFDFTDAANLYTVNNGTGAVVNGSEVKYAIDLGPNSKDFVLSAAGEAAGTDGPLYNSANSGYIDFGLNTQNKGMGCPRLFTGDTWTVVVSYRGPATPASDVYQHIFNQNSSVGLSGRTIFFGRFESATGVSPYTTRSFLNDGVGSHVLEGTNPNDGTNFRAFWTEVDQGGAGDDYRMNTDNGENDDSIATLAPFTTEDSVCSLGGVQNGATQALGYISSSFAEGHIKAVFAIDRILTTQEKTDLQSWFNGLEV
jgi:hypothetical protein